ncbi:MAG: hypothetical protein WD021_01380 [Rhodothermales bacterium]
MENKESAIVGTLVAALFISTFFFVPWRMERSGDLKWAPAYRPPVTVEQSVRDETVRSVVRYEEGEVAIVVFVVQLLAIAALGGAGLALLGIRVQDVLRAEAKEEGGDDDHVEERRREESA